MIKVQLQSYVVWRLLPGPCGVMVYKQDTWVEILEGDNIL